MIISCSYIRIHFLSKFQINFPTFPHWNFFYFLFKLISHLIKFLNIFFCEHTSRLRLFLLCFEFGLSLLFLHLLYFFSFFFLFFFDGFKCLLAFFVPFLFFILYFSCCFVNIPKDFIQGLFFLFFLFPFQDIPLFLFKPHNLSGCHSIVLNF